MKKIKISEGVKASLGDLINKVQSITNENQSELAVQLFTPGFFVKKTITGTLEADWRPSVVGSDINIAIRGRTPAYSYTSGGKILSLKETSTLDPRDIDGYTHYNPAGIINTNNVVYELWVVPNISESEPTDYLPNYKMTGETKYLVDNYLAGFLLIKKGSTPPEVIYNADSGLPTSTTPPGSRYVFNTVEGIKLAEFTYKESTNTITNLVDFRLENRAYLKPELYDFFNEAYLKHDYLLTHAEDSAGNNILSFNKNGINPPTLSGVFTLVSVKEKIVNGSIVYPSKIKVTANSVPVPVNSVLAITVTAADYVSGSNLTKVLEIIPIDTYTPNIDKILIGYHLRTFLDNGISNEEDSGISNVLPNLDGGDTPPAVNLESSVIYFVNGLPPLPPGQNISRSGIGSYVLTKDEAAVAYYNKTQSNAHFIKSGNDAIGYIQETHKNDIYHSIDGSTRTGQAYNGIKFANEDIPLGLVAGYAWLNHENGVLGYIHRGVNAGEDGYIEIGVFKNDGTGLKAFRIENGFLKVVGANDYPGNGDVDGNKLVTVAYGLLNRGDDAKGTYNWRIGKFVFYQPSEIYEPDSGQSLNSEHIPESSTIKVLQFNFDSSNPAVIDLLNHNITGSADPREGTEGSKDLVPRDWTINKINTSIFGIIDYHSEFDAIVKKTPTRTNEYTTVTAALSAGKNRIKIMSDTYNLPEYTTTSFWPTTLNLNSTGILIRGEGNVIINGATIISSTASIQNMTFENITFKNDYISGTNSSLVYFGSRINNILAHDIKFKNCKFEGSKTGAEGGTSTGTVGLNLASFNRVVNKDVVVLDNCLFYNNLIGIGVGYGGENDPLITASSNRYQEYIKILNCKFEDNIIGITILSKYNFLIENCTFISGYKQSYIAFTGNDTNVDSNTNVETYGINNTGDQKNIIIIKNNNFDTYNDKGCAIYFKPGISDATYYCQLCSVIISDNKFNCHNQLNVRAFIFAHAADGSPAADKHFKIILTNNYFVGFSTNLSSPNDNSFGLKFTTGTNESTERVYQQFIYGGAPAVAGTPPAPPTYYGLLDNAKLALLNSTDLF